MIKSEQFAAVERRFKAPARQVLAALCIRRSRNDAAAALGVSGGTLDRYLVDMRLRVKWRTQGVRTPGRTVANEVLDADSGAAVEVEDKVRRRVLKAAKAGAS